MYDRALARILRRKRKRRRAPPPAQFCAGRTRRLLALIYLCAVSSVRGYDRKTCRKPLGMQSGAITDAQLTASSMYVSTVSAMHARLHGEQAGGGWCPKPQIMQGSREYIEVDFQQVHVVTELATQGRNDNGRGQEFMEEYTIEYYRPRVAHWVQYKRWDDKKVFRGNSDTTTVVRLRLEPAIYATKLRVYPHSSHLRTICTRLEFYGCLDTSGLLSYTLPPSHGVLGDLTDSTYDGNQMGDGSFVKGLGRLVDGTTGADSFTLDVGHGRGTGWVAWKNSSFPRRCVDIVFEFDSVRNFTEINIYTNNFFPKGSQVFGRAVVYFHVEGMLYTSEPTMYHPRADLDSVKGRNVTIAVPGGGLARLVQLRLYFVRNWIMVSEVYFRSEPVVFNATDYKLKMLLVDDDDYPVFDKYGNIILDHVDSRSNWLFHLLLSLGFLTAALVLSTGAYIIVTMYTAPEGATPTRPRNKINEWIVKWTARAEDSVSGSEVDLAQAMLKLQLRAVAPEPEEAALAEVEVAEVEVAAEVEVQVAEVVVEVEPARRGRRHRAVTELTSSGGYATRLRRSRSPSRSPTRSPSPPAVVVASGARAYRNYDRRVLRRVAFQPMVQQSRPSTSGARRAIEARASPERGGVGGWDGGGPASWAESFSLPQTFTCGYTGRYSRKPLQERFENLVANRRIANPLEKIQLGPDYLWNIGATDVQPPVCPRGELVPVPAYTLTPHSTFSRYLDREVRVCTTEKLKLIIHNAPPMVQVLVAHLEYCRNDSLEYFHEVRMLAGLSHPALCCAVGIITSPIPPHVVLELPHADQLCRLLPSLPSTSFQTLIFIITQICSAMRHLESLGMVHRDLAARNCLMYSDNRIKVTDLAMFCNDYDTDYYVNPAGKKLPLRWMSWEATLLGHTSCASTVWAFGMTAWEVLQRCSRKPFAAFTNPQLITIHERLFYGSELNFIMHEALPLPKKCPQHLYRLLQRCWRRTDTERPSFEEIYNALLQNFHEDLPYEYML